MARLANGVRKRKDGTLEKRITIDGKRYSIYAASTKDLNMKEYELRERIKNGSYTRNANITLEKYYIEWKNGRSCTIKDNTVIMYDSYFKNHIAPILGKKKIKDLERREIISLQNELKENLAASTVNAVIKTLKIISTNHFND